MTIRYPDILAARVDPLPFHWQDREAMLYALAIGYGASEADLAYVYEEPMLKVMPTFATILANRCVPRFDEIGIDSRMLVHGEQTLTMHQTLPTTGGGVAQCRIVEALDKGDRGAVLICETELHLDDGTLLATLEAALFARANGHFGGPANRETGPSRPAPDRPCDHRLRFETRPDQALLYRLLGDRVALHADPQTARRAGFERPILHGLCTYGMALRAVLGCFALEPTMIHSHAVQFSAPILPGETIEFDLWRENRTVFFTARVIERDVLVLRNGRTEISI